MKHTFGLAAVVLTAATNPHTPLTAKPGAVRLVREGQPTSVIVVPRRPTEAERFAATELQRYVEKISGARLPIVQEGEADRALAWVLVGATVASAEDRAALKEADADSFRVRAFDRGAVLVGRTDRGTLYAVYDFLEQELGCRWLGPGPDWEDIPEQQTLEVLPTERTESPGMRYRLLRETGGTKAEPGSWYALAMNWALKQKINIGTAWPGKSIPLKYREQTPVPGGFRGWMSPHTGPNILLPPEQHLAQHPEWYSLSADGKRSGAQFCTTEPALIEAMADRLCTLFAERPSMEYLTLGAGDGHAFCQCQRCRALDTGRKWYADVPDYTHRWLTFVNAVAARVAQKYPHKKVATLAYHSTTRPPDVAVVRPAPNVMIELATWSPIGCRLHALEREDCRPHQQFREILKRWLEITPAGVMVYEYMPRGSMYGMPYAAPRRFARDIRYLHRLGVIGYEGQTDPHLWGIYGITKYTVAKAMWNPELNVEALVKDYCDRAFREASELIQQFFATLEEGMEAAPCSYGSVWGYLTPEVMRVARRHLDEAHAMATTPIVRKRLRTLEVAFRYAEQVVPAWNMATKALAEKNADLLGEAINKAKAALAYLAEEAAREPHYAGSGARLQSVALPEWERQYQSLRTR